METKEHTIVMLPTDRSSMLYIGYNQLRHTDEEHKISLGGDYEPQHLYILSDEEIKKGDWVFDERNVVFQFKHFNSGILHSDNHSQFENRCKKIIATTDKSLKIVKRISVSDNVIDYPDYVPQLPESFIQAYIKAYNEGKPITGVKLEAGEIII